MHCTDCELIHLQDVDPLQRILHTHHGGRHPKTFLCDILQQHLQYDHLIRKSLWYLQSTFEEDLRYSHPQWGLHLGNDNRLFRDLHSVHPRVRIQRYQHVHKWGADCRLTHDWQCTGKSNSKSCRSPIMDNTVRRDGKFPAVIRPHFNTSYWDGLAN